MKRSYGQIVEVAEAYEITVNIEVHGYFTTNPDRLEQDAGLLRFALPAAEPRHGQYRSSPGRTRWRFASGSRTR